MASKGSLADLPDRVIQLKRTYLAVAFVAIALLISSSSSAVTGPDEHHSSAKDRLIIAFSDDSTAQKLAEVAKDYGSSIEISEQLKLAYWTDWDNSMKSVIGKIPGVLAMDEEKPAHISFVPNDPYYSLSQWGVQRIYADQAWDLTLGSKNVTIAILDTGIDYTHEDLAANMWNDSSGYHGYDFWNDDHNPMDDNINGYSSGVWEPGLYIYHGTHVAGVVGAVTNNGVGIAGVAQVRLMAVKVMNDSGEGTDATVAQGIQYAVDNGADIITMSLGVDSPTLALSNAVNYAAAHHVLMAAAAGNDGSSSVSYPAAYPHVIAVGATDRFDHRASFSNYGSALEIMAPGAQIWSTKAGDAYQELSGTSTATPFVAGVAGLMLSVNPGLTPAGLRTVLNQTAADLGATGWDSTTGWGLVDARAAVVAVSGPSTSIIDYPTSATPNQTLTIKWSVSGSGGLSIGQTYLKWGYAADQLTNTSGLTYGGTTPREYSANDVVAPNQDNGTLYLQSVATINGTEYESSVVQIKVASSAQDPFSRLIAEIKNFIVNDIGLINFILIIILVIAIPVIIFAVRRSRRAPYVQAQMAPQPSYPPPQQAGYSNAPPPPPVPPPEALVVYVDIAGGTFGPASLEIFEGTRVVWRNRDWAPPPGISIVSGYIDQWGPHPDGIFASGMIVSPGEYWSAIFNVQGVYHYYISNMRSTGRIVVRPRLQAAYPS